MPRLSLTVSTRGLESKIKAAISSLEKGTQEGMREIAEFGLQKVQENIRTRAAGGRSKSGKGGGLADSFSIIDKEDRVEIVSNSSYVWTMERGASQPIPTIVDNDLVDWFRDVVNIDITRNHPIGTTMYVQPTTIPGVASGLPMHFARDAGLEMDAMAEDMIIKNILIQGPGVWFK